MASFALRLPFEQTRHRICGMGTRKHTLTYAPGFDTTPAENPAVFRDGDDVIIVLTRRLGVGFAVGIGLSTVFVLLLLYFATAPATGTLTAIWAGRAVCVSACALLAFSAFAEWRSHRWRTVLRVTQDAIYSEQPRHLRVARAEHSLANAESARLWSDGDEIELVLQYRDESREVLLPRGRWGLKILERVAALINDAAKLNPSAD